MHSFQPLVYDLPVRVVHGLPNFWLGSKVEVLVHNWASSCMTYRRSTAKMTELD
jgi:hypothetical protein